MLLNFQKPDPYQELIKQYTYVRRSQRETAYLDQRYLKYIHSHKYRL